jgi:SAM-dependent methyltransferase
MPFEVTVRGQRPWPAISLRPEPRGDSLADIFRDIAGSGDWGQGESESGFGSDLVQTAALRDALPKLVAALDVRRFLDIPCGDMFWMSQCRLGVEHYLGADVVPEIVARARSRFGADGRQLQVLDLVHDPLPRVDMVFSRDCLVHLDDNDIMAALRNVVRSQATYFAATTFVRREVNLPGTTGGWRTLNLCRAPFSLPAPLALINEQCSETYVLDTDEHGNQFLATPGDGQVNLRGEGLTFTDKSIGVWRTADWPWN